MASAIETILDNVAALAPTYDSDVSISVWNIDDFEDKDVALIVPHRMLLIVDPEGTYLEESLFISLGTSTTATWQIKDRLYIAEIDEGIDPLSKWNGHLIRYLASYAELIRGNRGITTQSEILSMSGEPGLFEWGSKTYFGVDVSLTIREFIGGPTS